MVTASAPLGPAARAIPCLPFIRLMDAGALQLVRIQTACAHRRRPALLPEARYAPKNKRIEIHP